jgi:hypothetical protein
MFEIFQKRTETNRFDSFLQCNRRYRSIRNFQEGFHKFLHFDKVSKFGIRWYL